MEGAFFKTEPDVGVEFVGFFEGVLLQIQDEDLAAGLEDAVGFFHRILGVLGVVEGLAQDREIDGFVGERDVLDIAEFVGEVGESVFGGELSADFDHTRCVVDAPDLAGAAGEELGEEAFAGAEIGDDDVRSEAESEVSDGFPRAAGAVVFAEFAGDEVKILLLIIAALFEDAVEVGTVFGEFGQVGDGFAGGVEEGQCARVEIGAEGVEGFFAVAAVDYDVGLAEEGELRGDARLGHAEDFLELGDGEFFTEEEREHAEARGVGEEFKGIPGGVHAGRFMI